MHVRLTGETKPRRGWRQPVCSGCVQVHIGIRQGNYHLKSPPSVTSNLDFESSSSFR